MTADDFIYYNLLKHGKILIALAGLVIAIIVFLHSQNFGIGVEQTEANSMKYCETNSDCFEHCNECVSIKDSRICEENNSIKCVCINNTCQVA